MCSCGIIRCESVRHALLRAGRREFESRFSRKLITVRPSPTPLDFICACLTCPCCSNNYAFKALFGHWRPRPSFLALIGTTHCIGRCLNLVIISSSESFCGSDAAKSSALRASPSSFLIGKFFRPVDWSKLFFWSEPFLLSLGIDP